MDDEVCRSSEHRGLPLRCWRGVCEYSKCIHEPKRLPFSLLSRFKKDSGRRSGDRVWLGKSRVSLGYDHKNDRNKTVPPLTSSPSVTTYITSILTV